MKTFRETEQVQIWNQLKIKRRIGRLSSLSCFLVMTTLFVYSCSDNRSAPTSSDPARGNNGGDPIEFSSDRVDPFDTVEIEGLPSNLNESDVWAEIIIEGFDEQIQTIIYREDDTWLLRAPYHPLQPMEGGRAQIYISDGEQFSTMQAELFLNPLDPAPGAFGEFAEAMSILLTGYLEQAGTSRTELNEMETGELTDIRAPLAIAYEMIDMPENENSIKAIASGSAPILNDNTVDMDVLDAVISQMKLTDLIQISQTGIDSLAKKDNNNGTEANYNSVLKSAIGSSDVIEISAEKLNSMMWAQQAAKNLNTDTHKDILNVSGQGLTVIGLAAPVPPVKAVAGAASMGLWAWGMIVDSMTHTFPSKFLNSENDLTVTPVEIPEDLEEGTWLLKPVAESNGWSIDKAILGTLLQIVGARGVKGMSNKIVDKMVGEIGEDLSNFLITDRLNSIISEVAAQPGEGILNIPPQKWTADVTKFSKMSVVEGSSVEAGTANSDKIIPVSIGASRLRIEKQEQYFAYQALLRFKNVEVHEIIVSIDPSISFAAPKSSVSLNATIQYAGDESLKWSVSNGVLESFDGKNNILYTPDVPWDKPIRVEAESMTRTGLREDGEPPRVGVALVYTDDVDLIIIPGGACIDPGDSIAFQAEVEGFDGDLDIHWSASFGTFNDNVYTAPGSAAGVATITASIKGTDIVETAGVKVGSCVCNWEATFSGDLGGTESGEFAIYENVFESGEQISIFTFWPEQFDATPGFSVSEPSILGNRETGSRSVVTFFFDGSITPWGSVFNQSSGQPVNDIQVNTGTLISGEVSGMLTKIVQGGQQEPDIFTAGFTLEYTARKKTAGNPNPCE